MDDYSVIGKNTPLVYADKRNASIATIYACLPDIYYKRFDIREFIGEQLATIRNVRSNHYFPLCFDRNFKSNLRNGSANTFSLKVGSFDFMSSDVIYKTAPMLSFYFEKDSFSILLDKCSSDENRLQFINENLEMFALDIYMSQCDRGGNTFYEFHPNGEIHVAPVFDYEMSLNKVDGKDIFYTSDFFQFLTIDDYQEMMCVYPQFREMLESYLDVSLRGQILSMARSRKFLISGIDLEYYERYDEIAHKKLEKILK